MAGRNDASPFLKWAGGKSQLLPVILPRLPSRVRTYFEPFLGGGAVFFALASARRFERAVISDKNAELINVYVVVQRQLASLIRCLRPHAERALDADYFYYVRSWKTVDLDPVERAARLLFLNRTCFNGLYRVNRRGEFNVPFGKYKNPKVLDEHRLRAASEALSGAEIRCRDFEEVEDEVAPGDAVYFDPPYVPVSATASFTAYHAEAFGPDAHRRLLETFRRCWSRGARSILSNSDCDLTRRLYAPLDVAVVTAARAINSAADRRGPINELLVVGPGPRLPSAIDSRDSAHSTNALRGSPAKIEQYRAS